MSKRDAGRFHPIAELSRTIPAQWYTDPEFFELDKEQIFYQNWWYFCHASLLAEPGSFYSGTILDQPIFVVRGHDGLLRGYYNACTHRAHPLLEGQGIINKGIICPYHRWCFSLEGALIGAPKTKGLEGFSKEEEGLVPIATHDFGGMVMVSLSGQGTIFPHDMVDMLAGMSKACPSLSTYQLHYQYSLTVKANWKVVIDNHLDNDHIHTVHPNYHEPNRLGEAVWTNHTIGMSHQLGEHVDSLREGFFNYIWPNTLPMSFMDEEHILVGQVIPKAAELSELRYQFFGLDTEPSATAQERIHYHEHTLIPEDVHVCEALQRGLHAHGYTQGRFRVDRNQNGYSEHHIHRFHAYLVQALADDPPPMSFEGGTPA